jgi:hypothetical protein
MGRRLAMTALTCVAPAVAIAATLPIDGTFGNDRGCQLARMGDYSEDDSARILTADGLQTMVTACSFDAVTSLKAGGHAVVMTCASEGSGPEDNTTDKAEISGNPEHGYSIRFADGTTWGPLTRC